MSFKNFRWNKVFPLPTKEKLTNSMKKSIKETGIEIAVVLFVVLGIWVYRWVDSTGAHSAEDLATDPSVASLFEALDISIETSELDTDLTQASVMTDPSTGTAQATILAEAETVTVHVPDEVYADALAVDVSSLGEDDYAVALNNNEPYFLSEFDFDILNPDDPSTCVFEYYSPLDELGRCGPALACLSSATMPADGEERGDISSIKPSGWQSISASDVDGGWLYNRSHLIAWSLAGENANALNLVTGTRSFNVDGMYQVCEEPVLNYLRDYPGIHILYRVTPVFNGDELVPRGVVIEAWSIEDNGGLSFCFFVPNVQSGWSINYATGEAEPAF